MLRPSFVPPAEIRVLRDYTRMRMDLTRERTRHYARLEKLLEDALMKVSAVAAISWSSISSVNNSRRSRRASGSRSSFFFCLVMLTVNLLQIWTTPLHRPSDTPSWARVLLDQIDSLSEQVARLSTRIEELIAAIPAAQGVDAHGTTGPNARLGPDAAALPALDRLDEITGIGRHTAQVIIAEIGLDMTRFPSPEHVASWAKLSPSTIQSGAKSRSGGTGKGNPYIKGALGEAAAAAARTDTFLGERYRRLVKRRGKLKALVALARSILVIVWHLLTDIDARFTELGSGYHASRTDTECKTRTHIRQLEALGYTVTLEPAA